MSDAAPANWMSSLDDPTTRPDEQHLVARVRAGDRAAFETLYRRYYRALVGFVYTYVKSEALAEEQIQELFLTVWRLRERWELHTTLRAYLYRGARNRALDYLKHLRIEEGAAEAAPAQERAIAMGEPSPAADAAVEIDELAAAARAAVERLPPRCRLVFSLRRDRELTYAEIAHVMDISEHTVKIQMSRALKSIRRAIDPYL